MIRDFNGSRIRSSASRCRTFETAKNNEESIGRPKRKTVEEVCNILLEHRGANGSCHSYNISTVGGNPGPFQTRTFGRFSPVRGIGASTKVSK
jgi:hypothetical protein